MALALSERIWNGTSGTFSFSVSIHFQEHLCRKHMAKSKIIPTDISREESYLTDRLVKWAALVISWVLIRVARKDWWPSRQVVYVRSRSFLSLMYLTHPSRTPSKIIWKWDIKTYLGWGKTDILVQVILEWGPMAVITLVELSLNYRGGPFTARLAKYLRCLSFYNTPKTEDCSLLSKLWRKGRECRCLQ